MRANFTAEIVLPIVQKSLGEKSEKSLHKILCIALILNRIRAFWQFINIICVSVTTIHIRGYIYIYIHIYDENIWKSILRYPVFF